MVGTPRLCRALGFAGAASAIDATEAEVGAAEVVNGVVALPTLGVEAWQAAVKETVYATRETQYVRETVNWTGLGGLQLLQRLYSLQTETAEIHIASPRVGFA